MPNLLLTRAQRLEGGLLGLLVGDALGVPYEFHSPESLPGLAEIEYMPPPDFARAHVGTPPGTWSDDGAQALCLLASLLDKDGFDADDFGLRLLRWRDKGYMAVGGRVFDIGITTNHALSALKSGVPALDAGPAGQYDNGNGALMRSLPLALWHRGMDAELVRDAHAQSRVTHGHMRSQVCCALYCLWARYELDADMDAWATAVGSLRNVYASDATAYAELEEHIRPDDPSPGTGSGYVVDCLRSARCCVGWGEFETVVRRAVALGQDTDTTACVAGGIAAIRVGVSGIPERWRTGLRGQDILSPLIHRLLESEIHKKGSMP